LNLELPGNKRYEREKSRANNMKELIKPNPDMNHAPEGKP